MWVFVAAGWCRPGGSSGCPPGARGSAGAGSAPAELWERARAAGTSALFSRCSLSGVALGRLKWMIAADVFEILKRAPAWRSLGLPRWQSQKFFT